MIPKHFLDRLGSWFLQGIAFVAPIAITIAFLLWLGRSLELFIGSILEHLLPPGWYLPGMGLVVGLVATLTLGLIANLFLVRWLVSYIERILDRIPLVKSVFQGLKDVTRFFAADREQKLGRVVAVEIQGVQLVGLVTQESTWLTDAPSDGKGNRIAVYLPMSYQIGGYTLYLKPEQVTSLDVGTEQALRAIITGSAPHQGKKA